MRQYPTSKTGIAASLALAAGIAFSAPALAGNSGDSYGVAVSSTTAATKTVDVSSLKRPYINVRCGDVVVFRNGDRSFTWKFDVKGHRTFDLAKVAPQGFVTSPLKVYVAGNDLEIG
ncbi:hypothetical protein EIP75_23320 [Aquabacterium soli]|uniref:CzcE family metal-binding protein n=1 Tax=Aquabacterium soli TaxID=2493092 RepID=A0A3R8T894_9BURK|nr:CzcE family metal-binding protein [Aquabacterium soli]RRR99975.1 hypothetical protein EIP75_23320 [Aquabacterium soli]